MKQFAVIGLGNFGYYLASHIYEKGHEVLAIDRDQSRVNTIKNNVSQAVVADATDAEAMKALGVKNMDAVIISIGSVLSDSILTTLNIKDIGVKKVYAKAISEPHGRILRKIGVTDVFFPEKDGAIALAEKLHTPNLLDNLSFSDDYSIIQLAVPASFIGRNLKEIDLTNKYGVQIIAIQEIIPERLNVIPQAQYILKDSDILILLGHNKSLDKLRKKTS